MYKSDEKHIKVLHGMLENSMIITKYMLQIEKIIIYWFTAYYLLILYF